MMCGDLTIRGLMRISSDVEDFKDIYQSNKITTEYSPDLPKIIVTEIAKEFIDMVTTDGMKNEPSRYPPHL